MEAVLIERPRAVPDVRQDAAHRRGELDAEHAVVRTQQNRQRDLDPRRDEGDQPPVMEDAQRLHIGPDRALHADQIEIDGEDRRDPGAHHEIRAEEQAHQVRRDERDAHRAPAVKPEVAQVHEFEHAVPLLAVFQRVVVADAGGHAVEDLRKQRGQRADEQRVIRGDAGLHQTLEIGDDDIVRIVDEKAGDAREQQVAGIAEQGSPRFVIQRLGGTVRNIRVFPFRDDKDHDIVQDRAHRLDDQVGHIIPREGKKRHLNDALQDRDDIVDARDDIILLRRQQERGTVAEKIRRGVVEQEHAVQQIDALRHVRRDLDEVFQERDHTAADDCGRRADDAVRPAEKAHQRGDLRPVVFRDGLIQRVDDGDAQAHLHDRQHRKDAGEEPVDAQIRLRQIMGENHTANKPQQGVDGIAAEPHEDVEHGIFRPGADAGVFHGQNSVNPFSARSSRPASACAARGRTTDGSFHKTADSADNSRGSPWSFRGNSSGPRTYRTPAHDPDGRRAARF